MKRRKNFMRDIPDDFTSPDDANEPGPWFEAGFTGNECSRGDHLIHEGDVIRADGHGEYECQDCVDDDQPYTHNKESLINELFGPKSGHGEWWKE